MMKMDAGETGASASDFWPWLREYVATRGVDRLGFIHPSEIRTKAAEAFGLRGIVAIWDWQRANRARLTREINRGLKSRGLRLRRGRIPGYALVERLPAE